MFDLATHKNQRCGGWIEDLPDLNTGRTKHGCGHYVDNNDDIVRLVLVLLLLIFI